MDTPGGQIPTFWPKITPNIGIIQITSLLDHLMMQSSHKYIFTTKHDGISSKLIAKQWGVTLYIETPGVKYPHFDQEWPEILVLTKELPYLDHMIMQSNHKCTSRKKRWCISSKYIFTTKHDGISSKLIAKQWG
jgi:hypothetical protein